ncbi:MAG: N-acetyltransferase [Desulfobacterales bacterium]|nr:N-acetyltransferase [Desulfobacterales bacterium]
MKSHGSAFEINSGKKEKPLEIRRTTESDNAVIEKIHTLAFGTEKGQEIAVLVKDLLKDETAQPLLSLVAVEQAKPIGHVLFTRAHIATAVKPVSIQLLGPLAILPDFQKTGAGGKLIQAGLQQLKASAVDLVFVLGHPDYYPRSGFAPAGALGFEAPYPIPEEVAGAWMVQELRSGVIGNVTGKIQCCEVFDQPEHWRE